MSITDMLVIYIVALLAGTGVGGGGLLVIYLTAVLSMRQAEAQAINLIFFIFSAAAALPYHIKREKIDLKITVFCAAFGIFGSFIGGSFRSILPEETVRAIFGAMLIATGTVSLFKRQKEAEVSVSADKSCKNV